MPHKACAILSTAQAARQPRPAGSTRAASNSPDGLRPKRSAPRWAAATAETIARPMPALCGVTAPVRSKRAPAPARAPRACPGRGRAPRAPPRALAAHLERHRRRAVAKRVVDEVLAGLGERQRIAAAGTGSSGRSSRRSASAEVGLLDDADGDAAQVDGVVRRGVGAMDDQRVVQELVGQPAEADRRAWMRATMRAGARGSGSSAARSAWARIAAIGVRSWCEASAIRLRMISNCRACRAMKRLIVADELPDLARNRDVERRQVARLALGEPGLDPPQRRQRRADRQGGEPAISSPTGRRPAARCG